MEGPIQALNFPFPPRDGFLHDNGFHKTQTDHCVFVKRFDEGDFLILLLYVDDMLTVRHNAKKIVVFMEDKTIEDWKQKKLVSSSQSTTFMELALVDPPSTHPVGRQQPFDEAVWEMEKMW